MATDGVYLQVLYQIYEAVKNTQHDATRPTILMMLRPVKSELEAIERGEQRKREMYRT